MNTASTMTRGFVNCTKSGSRATKLGREADCGCENGVEMVFMFGPSIRGSLLPELTAGAHGPAPRVANPKS